MTVSLDREELLPLLDRLVTETLEPAEHNRLEQILTSSVEARATYFRYLDLNLGLRQLGLSRSFQAPASVRPLVEPTSAGSSRRRHWSRSLILGGVVAVAVLATAWLARPWWTQRRPAADGPPTAVAPQEPREYVATLLFADDCRWSSSFAVPSEGQRLPRGPLHLEHGSALMRFDGGAMALLSGHVKLELISRGSARLEHGRLTIRAPEEALGFTLVTPAGEMVDLGTEFAVEVDHQGATELQVLEGSVERRQPQSPSEAGQLLEQGQAIRCEARSMASRPVAITAKRLDELLRDAKPRPREDRLLAYEGFLYPLGNLPLAATDGGFGWRGPWRLRQGQELNPRDPDSSTEMQIAFQKLQVPWPVRGGRAGMMQMDPGNNYRVRQLKRPLNLGEDAVYYVSLMTRQEFLSASAVQPRRQESTRLSFRSQDNFWSDRISLAIPPHLRPHVEIADGIRFTGPTAVSAGHTLLWVAKIVARRDGDDEVFLRLYHEGESLDFVEPADWSVIGRGLRSHAKLDLVLLTGTGQSRHWFDELRIGTSWRAVVPIAEPVVLPVAADSPRKRIP